MARYALNRDRLGPRADAIVREVGLEPVVRNPFRSILVRAVEIGRGLRRGTEDHRPVPPSRPAVRRDERAPLRPTRAMAITEAPRGMLYHRYRLDADGLIEEARIVAPTSQNQKRIEDDVRDVVTRSIDLDEATPDP